MLVWKCKVQGHVGVNGDVRTTTVTVEANTRKQAFRKTNRALKEHLFQEGELDAAQIRYFCSTSEIKEARSDG